MTVLSSGFIGRKYIIPLPSLRRRFPFSLLCESIGLEEDDELPSSEWQGSSSALELVALNFESSTCVFLALFVLSVSVSVSVAVGGENNHIVKVSPDN